jgi:hypothetical protein
LLKSTGFVLIAFPLELTESLNLTISLSEWNGIPEKQKARYHTIYGLSKDFKTNLAESEGFEPPDLLQSTVFKTAAFDHSASSPGAKVQTPVKSANYHCIFFILN